MRPNSNRWFPTVGESEQTLILTRPAWVRLGYQCTYVAAKCFIHLPLPVTEINPPEPVSWRHQYASAPI